MPRKALAPRAARRMAALSLFLCVAAGELQAAGMTDVTDQLKLRSTGFRADRRTGELVQAVTVTNTSAQPIVGTLYLLLAELDPGIAVKSGSLRSVASGSAIVLPLPNTSSSKPLVRGQSAVSIIRFSAPRNKPLRYRARILLDSGSP
jgi:hypothetical protein